MILTTETCHCYENCTCDPICTCKCTCEGLSLTELVRLKKCLPGYLQKMQADLDSTSTRHRTLRRNLKDCIARSSRLLSEVNAIAEMVCA